MPTPIRYRLQTAWWIMTIFAVAIAGYAFAFFFVDGAGSANLKAKYASIPFSAWTHILGGGVALLIGTFQMNTSLRKRAIRLHRNLGKIYLLSVLIAGLGGLVLAWYAEGRVLTKSGFAGLGAGWLFTGVNAYLSIRKRDVAAHRRWMIRNYALTFAAVTLRIYLPLSMMAGYSFLEAYALIAWMCWIPNLLVAEWFFIQRPQKKSVRRSSVENSASAA